MARECFCGCGRRIPRGSKKLNEAGRKVNFLAGQLEAHAIPFQESYLLFAERRDLGPDEVRIAREGAEDARGLVESAGEIGDIVAGALHEDDPTRVRLESLTEIADHMFAMDVHVRKTCFELGMKYESLPDLGPEGIVEFVEAKDRAR